MSVVADGSDRQRAVIEAACWQAGLARGRLLPFQPYTDLVISLIVVLRPDGSAEPQPQRWPGPLRPLQPPSSR